MCSLTRECVLLLENVFSSGALLAVANVVAAKVCAECVLLLENVFSY